MAPHTWSTRPQESAKHRWSGLRRQKRVALHQNSVLLRRQSLLVTAEQFGGLPLGDGFLNVGILDGISWLCVHAIHVERLVDTPEDAET